jgi:hypothetical protein
MYSRPRFLEELHAIREEMSRECDYDMDLFAVSVRNNQHPTRSPLPQPGRLSAPVASQPEPRANSSQRKNTK